MVEIVDERKEITKDFLKNLETGEYFYYKDHFFLVVYNTGYYYEVVDLTNGEALELEGDTYVDKISIKITIQN